MTTLSLSCFFVFIAYFFLGTNTAVYLCIISQVVLLLAHLLTKRVSGVGAFTFMYFLFFGIRPLYIIVENDYLVNRFLPYANLSSLTNAIFSASIGLLAFSVGSFLFPKLRSAWVATRIKKKIRSDASTPSLNSTKKLPFLIFLQLLATLSLYYISRGGRAYDSALGAYAYDFPVLIQSLNVFGLVATSRMVVKNFSPLSIAAFVVSSFLLLLCTLFMREMSIFRGFYLTGVIIAYISLAHEFRGKVGYLFLILTIVVAQPAFEDLGSSRRLDNSQIIQNITIFGEDGSNLLSPYWDVYNSKGDMNIFDTYIAASESTPSFRPFIWSWLYVPLHFVPRSLWQGKPLAGVTQDVSYLRGAPYSPGIVGFFYLDGGFAWMVASMAALGFMLSWIDYFILLMRSSVIKSCIYGIYVVNCIFLSRFLLWQFVSQALYSILPCVVAYRFLFSSYRVPPSSHLS